VVHFLKRITGFQPVLMHEPTRFEMKTTILLMLVCAPSLFAAPPAANAPLDELLAYTRTYKLGDDRRPLESIEETAAQSVKDPAKRAEVAAKLAGLLEGESTFEGRDFVFRELYKCGTAKEIPAVATWLGDEKFSHMARYVLESMANADADAAMRNALSSARGLALVGIVDSLGNRRDKEAAGAIAPLLKSDDTALAKAAARALGKIATPDATKGLADARASASKELKDAVTDAYLRCADAMVDARQLEDAVKIYDSFRGTAEATSIRLAAHRGLVRANPAGAAALIIEMFTSDDRAVRALAPGLAREVKGADATRALAESRSKLNPESQALLLEALADRGDPAAKTEVIAAAGSPEQVVRLAAIRTLAALGDASDVPMLVEKASKGDDKERDAARFALARLRGKDTDAAIFKAMSADAPEKSTEVIRALAARGAVGMVEQIMELAKKNESEPIRISALGALGALIEPRGFDALIELIGGAKSDAEREAARAAVAAAGVRLDSPDGAAQTIAAAIAKGTPPTKAALLDVLARIGGPKALDVVHKVLADGPPEIVYDAAVRALTNWREATAIPDLLYVARAGQKKHKVIALRGITRLMSLPGVTRNPEESLRLCRAMMEVAERPDEKRLVLGRLAELKDAGALELAAAQLKDPALRDEAASAVLRISTAMKADADAALNKIANTPEVNEGLRKQAQDAVKK
jgi:HEAT repeat protein